MTDRELSPLGALLEQARERLRISGREAARRARISEARWRQVVRGGDQARAPERTVVAMALAVQADPHEALRRAGLDLADAPTGEIEALVGEVDAFLRQPVPEASPQRGGEPFDILYELERIRRLDLPAQARLDLIKAVMDLYDEAQAEIRQQQHTN